MIRHIFRKDLRLLWPVAALVAAVQWLNACLLTVGGQFARSSTEELSELGWISNLALPGVALLGLAVLVIAVMQQDQLPGTTQDWLTRPIPRARLLAAKLLFVVLAGLAPVLAADLAMGAAEHLRPGDIVVASVTRSGVLLCLVCLPAALIGAVTRSLTQALVFAVITAVVLIIELIALVQVRATPTAIPSGFAWVFTPLIGALNLGAMLILLPLQLHWRSTDRVRWLLGAYLCALPAVMFVPWDAAWQIDRAFNSGQTVVPVSITLDASRQLAYVPTPTYPGGPAKPTSVTLRVPVTVSNLGPGNLVYLDRVGFRVLDPRRAGVRGGSSSLDFSKENQFGLPLDGPRGSASTSPQILLTFPFDAFEAALAAQSRIEIQLFATRFRLAAESPIQSLAASSIDDHGRCHRRNVERFGRSADAIYCVSPRPIGNCFEMKNPARPGRNVPLNRYRCGRATYAPWPLPLWRDAYYSVVLGTPDDWLPPVAADSSAERPQKSALIINNYVPDVHIARTLEITLDPTIRKASDKGRSVDGVGSAARFASPAGVVVDKQGNLFIVDEADSVVRKVTPAGQVSTFAGMVRQTGHIDGFAGEARFTGPHAIAIDGADNLFVADTGNGLIRKITPAGVVSTILGNTGGAGPDIGPLRFKFPRGVVCAPDGTLYVVDFSGVVNGSATVRKIAPSGVVSTVAGPDDDADGGVDNSAAGAVSPAEVILENN